MDSTLKNGINGLLTDKPLLPRVIGFVKASELGTSQKSKDVEDEPEQPQYSLFSRERFLSLFEEASPRRVGRGLQNHGNTCYFNSVLQVLMYTAPLQQFLLSKQHTSECKCKREGTVCTLCLLESHALEAFHSDRAPVKPVKLLRHMPQIASRFKTQGRQEDAHEFLIHFLDACHKSLLKQAAQQPVPRPVQQTTSICQLFGGFLRSQVLCLRCKHPSNTFDPFMDISLEVNNASSLEKALDAFTKSEQLRGANKYQCKKCQQKVDATKTFSIHTLPPVLSFQLKRFDFLHGFRGKLKKKVQFPASNPQLRTLSLNIARYTSHKDKEAKYNLYGLVVHCCSSASVLRERGDINYVGGSSAKSGHYIAYAKHNGNWFCFNDEDVRQVKEQYVLQQEAYLLFYLTAKAPQPAQKTSAEVLAVKQAASDLNKEHRTNGHLIKQAEVHTETAMNGVKRNGAAIGMDSELKRPKTPKSVRLHLTEKKESESSEKEHSEPSSHSDRKKEIGRIPRSRSRTLRKLQFYQDRLGTDKRKTSVTGDDKPPLTPTPTPTPPAKKQKVEKQDVPERVAATTDYTRQFGQAEVAQWDDVDMDPKTFAEAQEKIQPPVQRRDELDQEYDVGKKKHKPKAPKADFNGRSAFDREEQRRKEKKAGGGGKGSKGKGKGGKGSKGGKGGKGKSKGKSKGKGKGGKSKGKGKY